MFTVKCELASYIDECDVIKNIYEYGKDLVTKFETIEISITEIRGFEYVAMISETQRDIILENVDSLIALYLRLKANDKFFTSDQFYCCPLGELFELTNGWESSICDLLFYSIFALFHAIDEGRQFCFYCGDNALSEITIIVEGYLKYLGKEDRLDEVMKKVKEKEGSFHSEEVMIFPLKMGAEIKNPKKIVLPREIKYEVRREINGVFFATISEESMQELFKHKKEFVELAFDNYYRIIPDFYRGAKRIYPVFYDKMCWMLPAYTVEGIVGNINIMVQIIAKLQEYPGSQYSYVTRRHLEEIHILAQECLKIGFFDAYYENFSKEITDSAQLAQLIDTKIKTLDPPTGSKTKPAAQELYE